MQTIIIPTDGSESAQKAVEYCSETFSPENVRFVASYVAQPFPEEVEAVYLGGDTDLVELEQELLDASRDVVEESVEELISDGFDVEIVSELGDVGAKICDLARARKAHGIVMGCQGRNAVTEVLLGSISHYVVHHAPCAVTLVPKG